MARGARFVIDFVWDFIRDALADRASGGLVRRIGRLCRFLVFDLWTLVRRSLGGGGAVREPRPASPHWSLTMQSFVQDLKLGVRLLSRAPLFSLVAITTLALGIGATTAVFAVVDGAILRPFPYKDMSRIVMLSERTSAGMPMSVAYQNFLDWRTQNDVLKELGVYRNTTVTYSTAAGTERINAAAMSASVFDTMGIEAREGRRFGARDDEPGDRTALVSERFWRTRLGSTSTVIGSVITLNSEPHTIVGVMPPAMRFPGRTTDIWLPFGAIVNTMPASRGAHPGLTGVGRLRDGVSLDQARSSMATIASRLSDAYPNTNKNGRIDVDSYYEAVVQNIRPVLFLFLGAVGVVLLIACANLASMMLARGEARSEEMAVRAALGAGRMRLIRQLLTEALVLATTGGVAGIAVAYGLVKMFIASRPTTVPRIDLIGVDWRALAFAGVVAVSTALLIGVMPALRSSRTRVTADGRGVAGGGNRLRGALIVTEVALALMLLVGAGLLVKNLSRLLDTNLGYSPANVVTMRVALPDARYPTSEAWMAFHRSLLERFSGMGGIQAAALASSVPLAGGVGESSMGKEGDPPPSADRPRIMAAFHIIGGDYFQALGTSLVTGRVFDTRDRDGGAMVAIIDDRGAARLFPGENPIGKRITFESKGEPPQPSVPILREIIGVVPHITMYSMTDEPAHVQIYVPFEQPPTYSRVRRPSMAVVLRVTGGADAAVSSVRQIVTGIDPMIPVFGVQPLGDFIAQASETPRLGTALIGSISLLALILALVGIYGVLSYTVSQRTREIGVRVALGAGRNNILSLVARQAGLLVGIGLVLGTGGALLFARFIKTLLVNVSPNDPVVFTAVVGLLGVTAAVAALVPARRAARIDPVRALRG